MNQKSSVPQTPKSLHQVLTSDTYSYDAYGQRLAATEGVEIVYGYAGREYDPESGLMFYRARTYDPATGRFLQTDPLGFAAGDANLYRYVFSNPVNLTDPSGRLADQVAVDTGAVGQDIRFPGQWFETDLRGESSRLSLESIVPSPQLPKSRASTQGDICIAGDCASEWAEARALCRSLLSTPNPPRGITGGYTDVENCARGLVSARCGGNGVGS